MSDKVAITGLSCCVSTKHGNLDIQAYWQSLIDQIPLDLTDLTMDEASLSKLTNDAILDANIGTLIDKRYINIVYYGIKQPNFEQGLKSAIDQLDSKQSQAALIVVIDRQSAAAIVLEPLKNAEQKRRVYAIPCIAPEQQENKSIDLLTIVGDSFLATPSHLNHVSNLLSFTSSNQARCSLRESISPGGTVLAMPLIDTILSLQQKVLLPFKTELQSAETNSPPLPFYINASLRPWFYPQIHPQLIQLNPDCDRPDNGSCLRRAAMQQVDQDGNFFNLLLEESPHINEGRHPDFKTNWESELFTFCASDKERLFNYAQTAKKYITEKQNLKDLAFAINSWSTEQSNNILTNKKLYAIKVAFVATSLEDLNDKLDRLCRYCRNNSNFEDLYCNDRSAVNNEISQGHLAFVLPGLGAAYPDMLTGLCLHFPEVRAIFDFIDHVAISAGSPVKLSERIFPRRILGSKPPAESAATLAMMDSAVVTVLMAEWALFTLFLNLGITPDILLGCSTGEFAALTMSGAIDILGASPLFYHLSTGISKALPFNRLVNLRSLKIIADFTEVEKYLANYKEKIYLSADLSTKQLLVTGDKDSINALVKVLDDNNIIADFLPFAIPYHTSLVTDVVSPQDPDVLALQIDKPLIESWSCSLMDKYPSDPGAIRKISTELFSKPILFKNSVEALYAKGVRKFVEVGPRGNLAPIISETLQSNPHISIAANRADVSAITQLNHALAALFVNDTYMDLSYLYARRKPVLLPIFDRLEGPAPININKGQDIADKQFDVQSIEQFRKQLMDLEQRTISALKSYRQPVSPPDKWQHHINNPSYYFSEELMLSKIFEQLDSEISSHMICRQFLESELPSDEAALLKWADLILTPAEMSTFQSFKNLAKRKQWLSGRLALKETIRILFNKFHKIVLTDAEIEIASEESGKIYVKRLSPEYNCPVISVSHKDGQTIAIAADSSIFSAVGIDLESLDPVDADLPEFALSIEEQNMIQNYPPEERPITFKKIWAAKEAAAKVLGLGLPDYLKNLSIVDANRQANYFSIEALVKHDHSANELKDKAASTQTIEAATLKLSAYVTNLQNGILAISFCQPQAHNFNPKV